MVSRTRTVVNPIARVILAGVYLPSSSPLRILSSCPDAVERIYMEVKKTWAAQLIVGYDDVHISPQGNIADTIPWNASYAMPDILSRMALSRFKRSDVRFPPPNDLYCNMLPFDKRDFSTIPPEYHGYLPMIELCSRETSTRILYLTIHESRVDEYAPQRRPGIHVEGFLATPGACLGVSMWHSWGFGWGDSDEGFECGIFHGSTVKNSCRMWNVQIPRHLSDALQEGCDLEHLRGALNEVAQPVMPDENELWWMTDATPHESLPLESGTYRQYFRLVVGPISCWWSQHSTANRLGIQPDCRILHHNKFDEGAYRDFDRCETSTQVQCDLAEPST